MPSFTLTIAARVHPPPSLAQTMTAAVLLNVLAAITPDTLVQAAQDAARARLAPPPPAAALPKPKASARQSLGGGGGGGGGSRSGVSPDGSSGFGFVALAALPPAATSAMDSITALEKKLQHSSLIPPSPGDPKQLMTALFARSSASAAAGAARQRIRASSSVLSKDDWDSLRTSIKSVSDGIDIMISLGFTDGFFAQVESLLNKIVALPL
jgi:hypothetical protein